MLPEAIKLAEVPFLSLGGSRLEDSARFDPRNAWLTATVLSDSTIVVKDHVRLLFFSDEGRLIAIAGRQGSGPGEFQQVREVCEVTGSRVLSIDLTGRVALWNHVGKLIKAWNRPGDIPQGGCTPEGTVVIREGVGAQVSAGSDSSPVPLARHLVVSPDPVRIADIGVLPTNSYATFDASVPIFRITQTKILYGNGRDFEIRTLNRDGALRAVTRLGRRAPEVSDEEWALRVAQIFPPGRQRAPKSVVERFLRSKPDRFPAFSNFLLDHAGWVWVSDYQSEAGWTLIDTMGQLVGRFRVPGLPQERPGIAGFGPKFIVLRHRNSEGDLILSFHRFTATRG
jgi:hypothetical protein